MSYMNKLFDSSQINEHRDRLKEEADKEKELLKQRMIADEKVGSVNTFILQHSLIHFVVS